MTKTDMEEINQKVLAASKIPEVKRDEYGRTILEVYPSLYRLMEIKAGLIKQKELENAKLLVDGGKS